MSTSVAPEVSARPLTWLSEEEQMFRATVKRFAVEQITPLVREMDEHSQLNKGLLKQLFELGLLAIEIPEEYGGQGGSFFQSILAIEEIAAVDPSVGVVVDVQNTLVINAMMRWATVEQKKRLLPKLDADMWVPMPCLKLDQDQTPLR